MSKTCQKTKGENMTDTAKNKGAASFKKTKLVEVYQRPCKARGGGSPDVAFRVRGRRQSTGKLFQKTVGRRDRDGLNMTKLRLIRDALLRWESLSTDDQESFVKLFPHMVPDLGINGDDNEKQKTPPTFSNLAKTYFKIRRREIRQAGKSTKSIGVDENRFKNYIVPRFGDRCPHELKKADVVQFAETMFAIPLSVSTVDKLTGLLTWIDSRTVDHFPHKTMNFKMPKFDTQKRRKQIAQTIDKSLGDVEFKKLMTAALELRESNVARIRDAAHLVLLTGNSAIRGGATKSLRWEDVDLKSEAFELHRSVTKSAGHCFSMNPVAKAVLTLRHIRAGQPRRGWVFPTRRDGYRGHWERTSAPVWEIYEAAGLEHLKGAVRPLHGIRHYLAKSLVRRNISLKKVQAFMGHDSIAATMVYSDIDAEAKRETVDVVADLWKENGIAK